MSSSDLEQRHKNFAEALLLAVEILPIQLRITQHVRKMTEEERSLFQSMLNQHPAMLEELKDKREKERDELSKEELAEKEYKQNLQELGNKIIKGVKLTD